ncbi:hypothetical protein DMA11_06230 [Marinilabiliaceae bacterium JC017]|nr:hypothetical protein DMA11_06230 [Marinilabiliaceae bacterium JC017]
MKLYNSLVFCLFIGSVVALCGCSAGGKMTAAQKAFNVGEYHRAAAMFKKAYSGEKNKYAKGEISFYLGECYRHTNLPKKAASYYSKAVRYKYEQRIAELYMADAYRNDGKYEKALPAYESYLEKVPGDIQARNGILSCKLAMQEPVPNRYQIEKVKALNSKYNDYSPAYVGTDYDQVYFSSMRTEKKKRKRNRITGQGTSNIYVIRLDAKGKWTDPEPLDETVNTEFDEGAAAMSHDGKEMYFTRCRYDNTKPVEPEIYTMKRSGGRWSEPQLVTLGGDTLMFAHPALSTDGATLYFVSDMPGGVGGKDIWKTQQVGGEWGEPVNMGEDINTPGDEMFPYVRVDGTLYFCSDTHVGYGGLDIFKALKDDEGKWQIINLGLPINSSADDFGIVFKSKQEDGLLSSSRGSAKGVDNIFHFILPKLEYELKGVVVDQKTGAPLADAYLRLIGTDGTNVKLKIRDDGTFGSNLEPESEYVFLVAAKNHFNHKEKISTVGLQENKEFNYEIGLTSVERAIILRNIYFDAGTERLKQESQKELNRVVDILVNNTLVKVELGAHTDDTGDETENLVLSQKRAEQVMQYLIDKGVAAERLSAKGYGEGQPVVVDRSLARKYDFLSEGDVLNENVIKRLKRANQKQARQINRRIEFKLISDN